MILSVNDFSPYMIESIERQKRKSGNQSTRKTNFEYKDIICAFDIETTRYKIGEHTIQKYIKNPVTHKTEKIVQLKDDNIAIMYIWQFQFGLDITVTGRTWDEFNKLMRLISDSLKTDERIVVYVHNLSYEFQFIRDKNILGRFIDENSVFILSSRKVLRFTAFDSKLEFRCSYIHSNMSLDLFTDKMEVEHKKLSGEEFDYNKIRFPWTELTEKEIQYCINDVIGLVEALEKEMYIDGDNLYTIPLTSTGYVRRDIKKAIHDSLPHTYISERKPDWSTYCMLRDAFRGGNTHANRGITGKIINSDDFNGIISEYDRSSSYPDVQLNGKFPISKFHKPRTISKELFSKCLLRGYAIIARLEFNNIKVKDDFIPVPYISSSNCQRLSDKHTEDNGRILKAEMLEICVTDIDLNIILKQYDYTDMVLLDFRFATYGYIPECIKNVIRLYYRLKTELKGNESQAIIYMKSKNKLNSIYGNSAQTPAKLNILYKHGEFKEGYYKKDKHDIIIDTEIPTGLKEDERKEYIKNKKQEIAELLELIYEENNTVLPYQWGVWTTALARAELQKMIDICGDNFLYCDTDSVYFIQDGTIDFSEYNKEKIKLSQMNNALAEDSKGKTHYMGVAEEERSDIKQFKTLGAKKYAYITTDNKLYITISGVSKKYSVDEVLEEFNKGDYKSPLDVIDLGFQFRKAGGNEIIYNDSPIESLIIDEHELYIPTSAVIQPSTYEIGYGEDYIGLLIDIMNSDISIFYKEKFGIPIDISAIR